MNNEELINFLHKIDELFCEVVESKYFNAHCTNFEEIFWELGTEIETTIKELKSKKIQVPKTQTEEQVSAEIRALEKFNRLYNLWKNKGEASVLKKQLFAVINTILYALSQVMPLDKLLKKFRECLKSIKLFSIDIERPSLALMYKGTKEGTKKHCQIPDDPMESISEAVSRISNGTLRYQEVSGDGHNFYQAVALHLDKDPSELREAVAQLIENNLSDYSEYISALTKENGRTVKEYIHAVRLTEEWADNLEISVLMAALNTPIMIIGQGGLHCDSDALNYPEKTIFMYSNGDNYYHNALILTEAYQNQPKAVLEILAQSSKHFHQNDIHAKQAFQIMYAAGQFKHWINEMRGNISYFIDADAPASVTLIAVNVGFIVSENNYQKKKNCAIRFLTMPYQARNSSIICNSRWSLRGKNLHTHAEDTFLNEFLSENNFKAFMQEFIEKFKLTGAYKFYRIIFDIHSTNEMCDDCLEKLGGKQTLLGGKYLQESLYSRINEEKNRNRHLFFSKHFSAITRYSVRPYFLNKGERIDAKDLTELNTNNYESVVIRSNTVWQEALCADYQRCNTSNESISLPNKFTIFANGSDNARKTPKFEEKFQLPTQFIRRP